MEKSYYCKKINEKVEISYFAPTHKDAMGKVDSPPPRANDCSHKEICPVVSTTDGTVIRYNWDNCPIVGK